MDDRLFELILALIPVLGTILTVYIIPFVKEKTGKKNIVTKERGIRANDEAER